ncbi:uncharacterized protein LOC144547430 isoform X2 [Carex rostrata]
MEFLFDLLLTAFFSLLFAFFLSKLFSPSNSSSASTSSDDTADVISGGARFTEEDLPDETRAPRLREGEDLQEEKIIEVDKVVEKEAARGFLAEEGRSELSDSVGIGGGKVMMCEGTEERSDDFVSDVEFEKEKVDRGLVQKYESFELETSISSDKEKESCVSDLGDGKVSQSSDLTFLQDQSFVLQERSFREVELSEPEVRKDRDNLCEVEGSIDKMPREVELPIEEESCLREELEFKIASQGSVIVHQEISQEAVGSVQVVKAETEEHNLCEVEGPISKTSTEGDSYLKKLTVPQEISVEAIEPSEQKKGAETIESSEQKKGEEEEEEEDNLFQAEGPTSKIIQFVGDGKNEKEKAFIEEEGWEGIERTDIEKQFAVAAGYATSEYGTDALSKVNNEVQLQLYGLHKVATEGPCYESHPLALRASTRAKWYAWQKLGNMNPEAAMEEYMTLLSKNVPDWFEQPVGDIVYKVSDELTIESGSCIEGYAAFGSVTSLSAEKGTESHALSNEM